MKEIALIFRKAPHISRLLTGFHLLEKAGEIKCTYYEDLGNKYALPQNEVVEVRLEESRPPA